MTASNQARGIPLGSLLPYVLLCMFLIVVPYAVTSTFLERPLFATVFPLHLHLLIGSIICACIWSGYALGRGHPAHAVREVDFGKWSFALYLPILISIAFNLIPIGVWATNPNLLFYQVRDAITQVPGTGIGYMAYILSILPFVLRKRRRRSDNALIALLAATTALRSAIMIERLPLFALAIALLVAFSMRGDFRLKKRWVVVGGALLTLLVVLPVYFRLQQQGSRALQDLPAEFFRVLHINISYYSATINNLYAMIGSGWDVDVKWFALPAEKLMSRIETGGRLEYPPTWEAFLLQNHNAGTGLVWLNNPGGPTQDYMDFGPVFVVVIALKFYVAGRIERGARNGRTISLCFFPAVVYAVFEYPRFFLFYQPTGVSLILLGAVLGVALALRRTRGARPHLAGAADD